MGNASKGRAWHRLHTGPLWSRSKGHCSASLSTTTMPRGVSAYPRAPRSRLGGQTARKELKLEGARRRLAEARKIEKNVRQAKEDLCSELARLQKRLCTIRRSLLIG